MVEVDARSSACRRGEERERQSAHLVIDRNFLLQYPFRVSLCFSGVYRERLFEFDGLAELSCKDALLEFARRVVVVVVKADFSPSHATRMGHGFETVEDRRGVAGSRLGNSIADLHRSLDRIVIKPCFVPKPTMSHASVSAGEPTYG